MGERTNLNHCADMPMVRSAYSVSTIRCPADGVHLPGGRRRNVSSTSLPTAQPIRAESHMRNSEMTSKPNEQAVTAEMIERLLTGEWSRTVIQGPNPTAFTTDETKMIREVASFAMRALEPQSLSPAQASDDVERVVEKSQYTLKGVEKETIDLMRRAASFEGMKIGAWVSRRMREAAERALYSAKTRVAITALTSPIAEDGLREALVVIEQEARDEHVAYRCCLDWIATRARAALAKQDKEQ